MTSELTTQVYRHKDWEDDEDFTPIPGLFDPDGDIVLIFLSSNGIEYFDKTSDPWYRATRPGNIAYADDPNKGIMVYQPEEAASPMACVRQFQFCNPSLSSNNCGPLASWDDAQTEAAPLFGMTMEDWGNGIDPATNNTMGSRYAWLVQTLALGHAPLGLIISDLGPDALTSLKYLSSSLMGTLPDNQWQLDVHFWWATFLASLQAAFVNTARGPTDPALDPYKVLPWNPHARDMCNNQVRCLLMQARTDKLT